MIDLVPLRLRVKKVAYRKGAFAVVGETIRAVNPLLLGFEEIERLIDRTGKTGNEAYPYNIERIGAADGAKEMLRITIALAGFTREQLENRGRGQPAHRARPPTRRQITRVSLSRNCRAPVYQDVRAGRRQHREVQSAELSNGLLAIDLVRHEPHRVVCEKSRSATGRADASFRRESVAKAVDSSRLGGPPATAKRIRS